MANKLGNVVSTNLGYSAISSSKSSNKASVTSILKDAAKNAGSNSYGTLKTSPSGGSYITGSSSKNTSLGVLSDFVKASGSSKAIDTLKASSGSIGTSDTGFYKASAGTSLKGSTAVIDNLKMEGSSDTIKGHYITKNNTNFQEELQKFADGAHPIGGNKNAYLGTADLINGNSDVQQKYQEYINLHPEYKGVLQDFVNQMGFSATNLTPTYGVSSFVNTGATKTNISKKLSVPATLALSFDNINDLITYIDKAKTQLQELWNGTILNLVNQIEGSWFGADSAAYIEKVKALEPKINNMIKALELLSQTYKKSLEKSRATQQASKNAVNSL